MVKFYTYNASITYHNGDVFDIQQKISADIKTHISIVEQEVKRHLLSTEIGATDVTLELVREIEQEYDTVDVRQEIMDSIRKNYKNYG